MMTYKIASYIFFLFVFFFSPQRDVHTPQGPSQSSSLFFHVSFSDYFFFPSFSPIKLSYAAPSAAECAGVRYPREAFRLQPDITKVYLRVDELYDQNFKKAGLVKFASVYGIRILAEAATSNRKILHVATNLAELLDSKQTGKPSSEALLKLMNERHATLAIASNSQRVDSIFASLPPSYECVFFLVVESEEEIIPQGPLEPDCPNGVIRGSNSYNNNRYDKCIGLIADFVIQTGYPLTYPPNSELGRLLRQAFLDSKRKNWLDVNKMGGERECDRECQEVAFQSWALTSALGVDPCTCRRFGVWTLCTPQEMKRADARLYGALTQDIRKPTGYYWSSSVV